MDHEYTLLGLVSLSAGSWAEWFSGIMSALAVITALAAYPIALRQQRSTERRRDAELGRAVGWKALKILNATADIDRHIKAGLARRGDTDPPGLKFPLVQPLGVPERPPQELNQSETDLLLKAKAADLLAEIDMCVSRYASIVYAMNEYKNRHEALFELMPAPVAREGMLFTHILTPEQNARVGPYVAMLESLLDSIIALVEENMAKANAALVQYGSDMERHFGKPLLTFQIDPAVAGDACVKL